MKKVISCHQDLRVWRKSKVLGQHCSEVVGKLPVDAAPLGKRIRQLAESIVKEIERGFHFRQLAPYIHHLARARIQVESLEPLLIEGCSRGWVEHQVGDRLLKRTAEIQRMLRKLILSLESTSSRRRRHSILG
jgi:four helix bundle protein